MTLSRVHALTASELALLRTRVPAARTDLFLAIWPMFEGSKGDPFNATVWTGLVDEPGGITNDRLFEIDYDNGSGAADFGNTLPDMTVYVGTSAGDDDLGRARLRGWSAGSTGVAGTMLLGEMSEIDWQDNAHLTVIDDFNLWPRHLFIDSSGVIYMDHGYYDEVAAANVDGSYTDQHQYPDPVPVLGPDAIGWMSTTGNFRVYFDASNSFTLDGGALSYIWSFPGSVANGGLFTAATWAEYNAAGVYRADCQVTRNYPPQSAFTGRRRVWVFDDDNFPTVKFELLDCSGDFQAGGWTYRVRMWDEARLSEIVDRARCVLFARDWFSGTEQSVGPYYTDQHGGMTIRENIVCNGWIAGESIIWDNETQGNVEFDVRGPQFWFQQMTGFPHGVENSDAVPSDWFEYQGLTVRDGLWSFLHWRSTATRMMDIELTTDSREIAVFSTPIGNLWDQMVTASQSAILAPPACDRYGALIVEIPLNLEFTAQRAGTPTVLAMTLSDWRDQVDINRVTVIPRSLTDLSGVYYVNAATATAFFSLAKGHIFERYGKIGRQERLALFSAQGTNNSLCGLVHASENNDYPQVDYRLAGNYRVFDIVPRQRIQQSLAEPDTERGIVWSNKLFLPRALSFLMQDGAMLVDMTVEGETGEADAVTGDPPPTTPPPPEIPPLQPLPPIEPTPDVAYGVVVMNHDQIAVSFNFFDQANPDWYDLGGGIYTALAGVYQDVAVRGIEAWVTTRDDANLATTGLFYCSDISQAVPVWTLIKSATNAANDTGYSTIAPNRCHLGSLWMRDDDDICAMIHSEGNGPPPAGQSGVYIGSGGVVAINLLPLISGNPIYQHQTADGTLHCVWGGAGNFYVAGRCLVAGQRAVVHEVGGATIDFDPPDSTNVVTAHNGYVQTWNIIAVPPNSNVFGGGSWNPASSEALTIQQRAGMGIVTDYQGGTTTPYMYSEDDALYDLYISGLGIVGDATNDFPKVPPGAAEGSYAEFFPFDTQQIVWIAGTSPLAFANFNIVLYTDDQGTTWSSKDGAGATSLQNALGGVANWSGWTTSPTANSIIRIFEY